MKIETKDRPFQPVVFTISLETQAEVDAILQMSVCDLSISNFVAKTLQPFVRAEVEVIVQEFLQNIKTALK